MREIKFRGQRSDNGYWVYGYYIELLEGVRKNPCIIVRDEDAQLLDENDIKYYVIRDSVGEFTGLQDKNGVDIYEGDIVTFEYGDGKVYYDNGCFMVGFNLRCDLLWLYCTKDSKTEVVGNIHEG